MRRTVALMILTMAASTGSVRAQTTVPTPSPFPGASAPPSSSAPPRTQPSPEPATPATPPAARPATPRSAAPPPAATAPAAPVAPATQAAPSLPGVPLYPTADYLDTVPAGSGQSYYLYGTTAPFAEIVAYYRTTLKNGGREIYRTPGTHQFDLGRFNEDRMAYPPSVVIKDYSADSGYLFVMGTTEKRYPTIIQIVPAAP